MTEAQLGPTATQTFLVLTKWPGQSDRLTVRYEVLRSISSLICHGTVLLKSNMIELNTLWNKALVYFCVFWIIVKRLFADEFNVLKMSFFLFFIQTMRVM